MSFRIDNHNPLPQVVELKSTVVENKVSPGRYSLATELGIFEEEISLDKATIEVGLNKATLSLALDGLDIDESSKYGVQHIPSQTVVTRRSTNVESGIEETKAREVIASGEISTLNATSKMSASKAAKTTYSARASLEEQSEVRIEHFPVKYVGNRSWRVTDPAGKPLDATYLNYDRLCDLLSKAARPNRVRVLLSIHAKAKDISACVTHDEKLFGTRTKLNKDKVLGILVAKALHEVAEQVEYRGTITFSVSVAEDEG